MDYLSNDPTSVAAAKAAALQIAFAPIVFQSCRVLRDTGILECLHDSGANGLTLDELAAKTQLPHYGIKVLLESGLGIELIQLAADRYTLTLLGYLILRDPMTRVNMDFTHRVCYRGLFDLEQAIKEGQPTGLKHFGDWKTIYEALSSLPPDVQRSWYAFDHYYSDMAFPAALPLVFADRPQRLLDVAGNTGRWAAHCARYDAAVRVTIVDLPGQLPLTREAIRQNGLEDRVDCLALDLLDESQSLPTGYDAIWMSQFLDCFSDAEVVSILRRTTQSMSAGTSLFILDAYWDRQPSETAAFCVQQTSLYFTCIANGRSQMRPAGGHLALPAARRATNRGRAQPSRPVSYLVQLPERVSHETPSCATASPSLSRVIFIEKSSSHRL